MSTANWIQVGIGAIMLISILCGQLVLWVRFKTLVEVKMQVSKEQLERHEVCLANLKAKLAGAITMPQHDKMQEDCQRGIYNDISSVTGALNEVKGDVKETNNQISDIALTLVSLRSDLEHIGAITKKGS